MKKKNKYENKGDLEKINKLILNEVVKSSYCFQNKND